MVIGDAIFTLDPAGLVRSFNSAATRLFGYEEREIVGQPASKLIGEAPRPGAFSTHAMHKDGSSFPVRLTVHGLPGEGPVSLVAVVREAALRARGYEAILNEHSLLLATLEATADG
ncbi:MAG: PAS domain-containing protein, partial [Candidatus Eremiobacteraeota bacterium]|nr:PAS domain-containing protein [Candidatus Eremiobacteraeota bacterium]